MEIVPLITPLGITAGILHEITTHKRETRREELPPVGSIARGAMLGGLVGLAADIGLPNAGRRARAQERARSGRAGGTTSRSGRTGGDGLAAAGIQGSSSGLLRASHRRSGKSGG